MKHPKTNTIPTAATVALPGGQSDARPSSRTRVGDFVELTKPRLNFLVLITTMVGYYMAAGPGMELNQWVLLLHALIGTALTAGAASALNQFVERDLDAKMARTADRPLPTGRVTPREGLIFGVVTGLIGVGYLAILVNPLTAAIGAFTLLCYVLVYTPMKRLSTLNTVIGAVPGALPPVMGMTAFHNALTPEALALFMILFIWQMPHFLAIAVLYRQDYADGGFRMLPVVDPELEVTSRQMMLYALAMVPVSLMPAMLGMAGWIYSLGAVALGAGFAWCAIRCAVGRSRRDARLLFVASIIYLPLLLAAMMVGRL